MNWNYVSESVDGAIGAAKATKGYKQFNACINADKKKKKKIKLILYIMM